MTNIIKNCYWCDGTGTVGIGEHSVPCLKCEGTGKSILATVNLKKIERLLEAICKKLEIEVKEGKDDSSGDTNPS